VLDSTKWLVFFSPTAPGYPLSTDKAGSATAEPADQDNNSDAGEAPRRRAYLPARERRQQILEAAREVFSRTSLQGARTRDLARAAGINQATLYGHFDSKEELFTAAVVQPLVDVMQGMQERAGTYQAATSPDELLQRAEASVRNHLANMCDIYPLLTAALFSDPELGGKLYREQIKPIFEQRGAAMSEVIRPGIEPQLFSLLAFGMFFAVAMDRSFTGSEADLDDIAAQVADLAAFGFSRNQRADNND